MRVLLDHCVPRPFRKQLIGHTVSTTEEMGWSDKDNGELLALAASAFEAFVTVDQNVQFQQNLKSLPLPVVVVACASNRLDSLIPLAPAVLQALANVGHAQLQRVEADGRVVAVA